MVEIWDGLGLDRVRHAPRHVIARWPRVNTWGPGRRSHSADALHHRLPIALASLKSKDMRRKAKDERADVTTDGQASLSNGTLQRKRTLQRTASS